MGAPRAWTTVAGQDTNDRPLAILGQEALRTVYFDPDFARVEVDTSVSPPRVFVSSPAVDNLQRDLNALTLDVTALAARITALEQSEEATVVTWSASIALDWDVLPTRTVEVTMPINMPNTSFVPTNMVQGVTYKLLLKHPLGGLAADGLDWTNGYWVMNAAFSYNFSGDPNEGLVLVFVAAGATLTHVGGGGFAP